MSEHQKHVLADENQDQMRPCEWAGYGPQNLLQLQEHLRFEELLSEMSVRFINLPGDQVDAEIENAQRRVCECLGFDLSAFWEWETDDHDVFLLTHLYRPLGGAPVPERMTAEEYFPWSLSQLAAHKYIAISSIEGAPAEAAADMAILRHYGIQSNLDLFLGAGGAQPLGVLSFSTTQTERIWTEPLIKRLQLVAQIFTHALVRRRFEQELQDRETRLSLAADAAGVGLWGLDVSTNRYWLTDQARETFGFSTTEVITLDRVLSIIHPEDRAGVLHVLADTLATTKDGRIEYRIVRDDGKVRRLVSRGRVTTGSCGRQTLMGVTVDFTETREKEDALRLSQARVDSAIDVAGLSFYELDASGDVRFLDEQSRGLCGVSLGDEARAREYWLSHIYADDLPRVLEASRSLFDEGHNVFAIEYRYLHPTHGTL